MRRFRVSLLCLSLLLAGTHGKAEDNRPVEQNLPAAAPGTVVFQRDIQPIFKRSCLSCHGPDKQRSGLRLDNKAEALKGGDSGVVIKPGDAAHSRLLLAVAGLDPDIRMPPEGKELLTSLEIGRLRAWIEQGANWPQDANSTVPGGSKSPHWALIPPRTPPAPKVLNAEWLRNPIDAFVLGRLEKEKITPSPQADRATLIRRLSLDLLGLPPTPQEVDDFLNDSRPDAYEVLVDRLLRSPHYGERWGRHWLDLARYADSDGFEKDTGRPFAWRYRNWVIEALNRDLPFDEFTIEQLAGDLLPSATIDQKIATGFHRNTLTNREGGVDAEQFRVEQVVDRVNTTAKVFLGVTLGCAQCHDHKYDPFSQREYYQFAAFFNSDAEIDIPAPLPGEVQAYQDKKAAFDKKHAELQAAVANYKKMELPANQESWERELKLPQLRALPANIATALVVEPNKRTASQTKELADHYAKTDAKLAELTKAVADHQKKVPKPSQAQTLALGSPRETHVLLRGDFLRPGALVRSNTPAVLGPLEATGTATRLDLAKWLVSGENPLTSRVITNWMWHHYFGRGLVATLEDFGTQGDKPTHSELLDWLATEFVRQKWSMKAMHRLIVTSATYRQSSRARPELVSRDPLNTLLARQNRLRLEAEIVRDVALASSGLLNATVGGPSVRPPQPQGISELSYAGSVRWVESTGADRYRRGMYTWFQRTSPYPMLITFDAPDSNICCARRERSNTPLQALTLLNDTVFVECAQALGKRIVSDRPTVEVQERLRHGFRLCLGRDPTAGESATLIRLLEEFRYKTKTDADAAGKLVGQAQPIGTDRSEEVAWVLLARTLLNLDEFVTRE